MGQAGRRVDGRPHSLPPSLPRHSAGGSGGGVVLWSVWCRSVAVLVGCVVGPSHSLSVPRDSCRGNNTVLQEVILRRH